MQTLNTANVFRLFFGNGRINKMPHLCVGQTYRNCTERPSPIQTITVGLGISPSHATNYKRLLLAGLVCATSPPIGNFTLPRRFVIQLDLIIQNESQKTKRLGISFLAFFYNKQMFICVVNIYSIVPFYRGQHFSLREK